MDRVEVSSTPADEEEAGAGAGEGEAKEQGPKVVDRRRLRAEDDDQAAEGEPVAEEVVRKPTFVEELEKKVAVAEEKLRGHIERIDKESAEFRARQGRELERRTQQSRKDAVSAFLGIADDMGRATAAASGPFEDPAKRQEALESLVEGVRMIQGRFFQELASFGVKPFSSKGEKFDPERHEAVRTIEVNDPKLDGLVVEELAQGYLLGDEVLRPGTVAVGKFSAPS